MNLKRSDTETAPADFLESTLRATALEQWQPIAQAGQQRNRIVTPNGTERTFLDVAQRRTLPKLAIQNSKDQSYRVLLMY